MRQNLLDAFAARGIGPERLILRAVSPHHEMLTEYSDMDIALDSFPFSGGLTSCEALWMNVPVVTLPGSRLCRAETQGFLQTIGLPELVASSADEYVRIATELAAQPTSPRGPAADAAPADGGFTFMRRLCFHPKP